MFRIKVIAILGALLMLTVLSGEQAVAQTNVFNAPTTDVVGRDQAYVEFQYLRQVPDSSATSQRTSVYAPRAVVGLPGNVEVGANVSFVRTSSSDQTNAFFAPNVKWKFYDNEEHGVAASGGGILFTPVNNRAGSDTFGMVYTNVSKKVQATYGPRLTAGVYGVVGSTNRQFSGPRAGAIVDYEQPIHPRVSFAADWLSGKNGFGYFTPGVAVKLPKDSQLKLGYSFGNDTLAGVNRDNNDRFLTVKYGINF